MWPTLAAELVLISHHEQSGKLLCPAVRLNYALAGALLVELELARCIELQGKRVAVLNAMPRGEPELDRALALIATAGRMRKPLHWVRRLGDGVRVRLLERLADAGILDEEHRHVIGPFTSTRYPSLDPRLADAARARVLHALRSHDPSDYRTAALVRLLFATGVLTRTVLRKPDKRRLKQLEHGQWAAEAVSKAIRAVESG